MPDTTLAELEVFHSRPIAPTRGLAFGDRDLPVSPAPGFGGILLGGIVAAHIPVLDPEMFDDLDRLSRQLEAGFRIPQPRLRHRLQVDRVGLQRSVHRLKGGGEALSFEIDEKGAPAHHVLAAVYAAGRAARRRPQPGDGSDPQGDAVVGSDRRHARRPPHGPGEAPLVVVRRSTATRGLGDDRARPAHVLGPARARAPSSGGSATWCGPPTPTTAATVTKRPNDWPSSARPDVSCSPDDPLVASSS